MAKIICDNCHAVSDNWYGIIGACPICTSSQIRYLGNAECTTCKRISFPHAVGTTFTCIQCGCNGWTQVFSVPNGPVVATGTSFPVGATGATGSVGRIGGVLSPSGAGCGGKGPIVNPNGNSSNVKEEKKTLPIKNPFNTGLKRDW